jgi:DNA-binding response OmpR family regulator
MGYRMPIIFVTACQREDLQQRALGAGAIGYMGKPFEEKHLIACLDAALRADV